ncbi:MAG: response regulator [Candidatus Neomarinimicrobiota bacterium]
MAIKILITDDEESFLASTSHILKEEGYECHCAASSAEALATLAAEDFDLVLADIRMPGNSELKFFRQVRENYPNLPLIVITGYPSIDTAIRSIQLKVWDYIVKPFDIDGLKERVKSCLIEKGVIGS